MPEKGSVTLTTRVPAAIAALDRVGMQRAEDVAIHVRNTIVESFSGPRSGRTYPKPPPAQGTYTASAKDERPAKPTGILAGLIQWHTRKTRKAWEIFVGIPKGPDSQGYVALETKPGKGQRPYMVPGVKDAEPGIKSRMERRWLV